MKTSNHAAFAAVALSCLFAAAVPTAASAAEREPVQVRISTKGLDLHTDTGRRALESRIVRAAQAVCAPHGATLDMRLDAMRCVKEMRTDGANKLAALAGTQDVRLASLPGTNAAN
jgi:UrcA family protein